LHAFVPQRWAMVECSVADKRVSTPGAAFTFGQAALYTELRL
jgi:hypothetical protein